MTYRREFDPRSSDSLAKLARWIRPGSCVLELGAATGYFTAHLRSLGCIVDLVEIDAAAVEEARAQARRAVLADLDGDEWLGALDNERYDAIVCADVLEHLRDAERLLSRLRTLLSEGGELLLSVPNIAHSAIIASLVDERFEYGDEGLLDRSHTRFYTWRSLSTLLNESGFTASAWDATTLDLYDTEFRLRSESIAPWLRDALAHRPNAHVYQWLVRAVPGETAAPLQPTVVQSVEHVTVRLLHAPDAQALRLERALVAELPIGAGPITLEWRLSEPAAVHRLMLADRIGIIRIASWRLFADDEAIWSSDGVPPDAPCSDSVVRIDGTTLALIAPDAWIDTGAAPEIAIRANRVTASLEWPASIAAAGDYRAFEALASMLYARREVADRLRVELGTIRTDAARLAAALGRTQAELDQTHAALAHRVAEVSQLNEAIAGYRAENARLEAALAAQERIISYRQSVRWWVKLPLVRARLLWHRFRGA